MRKSKLNPTQSQKTRQETLQPLKHAHIFSKKKSLTKLVNSIKSQDILHSVNPKETVNNLAPPNTKVQIRRNAFKFDHFSNFETQKADLTENLLFLESKLRNKLHAEAELNLRLSGQIKNRISPELKNIQHAEASATARYMAKKEVFNKRGEKTKLSELHQSEKQRYSYLMRIGRGLDKIAEENKLKTYLITIPVPGGFSRGLPSGIATIMNDRWKSITRGLSKKYYGLQSIEPHTNGLPHFHYCIVCDELVFLQIKKRIRKGFSIDPKIKLNKRKNIYAPHLKEAADKNPVQKTFDYLLKTLDPEDSGFGAFKKDGIKKFKLIGKLRGISQIWKYSRQFELEDLADLKLAQKGSLLPSLAFYAKSGDSYNFLKTYEQTPNPKIIILNGIKTDYYLKTQTVKLCPTGMVDGNGYFLSAKFKDAAKMTFKNTNKTRNFGNRFFKNKKRKATQTLGYGVAIVPYLNSDVFQLAQDISKGTSPSPLLNQPVEPAQNPLLTLRFEIKIDSKINFEVENPWLKPFGNLFASPYYHLTKEDREYLDLNDPSWFEDFRHENDEPTETPLPAKETYEELIARVVIIDPPTASLDDIFAAEGRTTIFKPKPTKPFIQIPIEPKISEFLKIRNSTGSKTLKSRKKKLGLWKIEYDRINLENKKIKLENDYCPF